MKSIDKIKTLKDIYDIVKPDKNELILLNYKGKSKRLLGAKAEYKQK